MTRRLHVGIIDLGRMGQVYASHLVAMPEVDVIVVSDVPAGHSL